MHFEADDTYKYQCDVKGLKRLLDGQKPEPVTGPLLIKFLE